MESLVSGRAARGSGYTIPGLCLPASFACLKGSVIKCLEVISLTVGSRILSGVNLGQLINPPDFRVVLAKRAISILIGCWVGML